VSLYRVLKSLQRKNYVIAVGDFITGADYPADALDKLEAVGAIGLLHAPPLSELPDFDGAEQLAAIGIVQADQLLECDIDETCRQLNLDTMTLREWRAAVSNWLILPVRAGG
jgi:hypothetical protein